MHVLNGLLSIWDLTRGNFGYNNEMNMVAPLICMLACVYMCRLGADAKDFSFTTIQEGAGDAPEPICLGEKYAAAHALSLAFRTNLTMVIPHAI